jgi:hypothetical protein
MKEREMKRVERGMKERDIIHNKYFNLMCKLRVISDECDVCRLRACMFCLEFRPTYIDPLCTAPCNCVGEFCKECCADIELAPVDMQSVNSCCASSGKSCSILVKFSLRQFCAGVLHLGKLPMILLGLIILVGLVYGGLYYRQIDLNSVRARFPG